MELTTAQMRRAERLSDESGVSYARLMEQAGDAAYRFLQEQGRFGGEVLLLAGSGNNGGDGFVIVQKLLEAGRPARVILCCGVPKTKLALEQYQRAMIAGAEILDWGEDPSACIAAVRQADTILDGILAPGSIARYHRT